MVITTHRVMLLTSLEIKARIIAFNVTLNWNVLKDISPSQFRTLACIQIPASLLEEKICEFNDQLKTVTADTILDILLT